MNKILLKDNFTAHCFAIIITLCRMFTHKPQYNSELRSLLQKYKRIAFKVEKAHFARKKMKWNEKKY